MVNPTAFLGTTAMVHPWDKSSWSCLWTKFQRQQKTLVFWVLERNDLDVRVPPFTELFRDLCARVQLQPPLWHRQQVRPSTGENWGWKHPETSMPWPLVQGKRYNKHKWFPVVHLCCPGWDGRKQAVLGEVKEDMSIVEAMERLGSRNGKTQKTVTIADRRQL